LLLCTGNSIENERDSIGVTSDDEQLTLTDDFNECPASCRTSIDVPELAANTDRHTPSHEKLCTAFGMMPRGN
jgi:hypothetical protein